MDMRISVRIFMVNLKLKVMKDVKKKIVVKEILDILKLQQESGVYIPKLSNERIDQIADSILFEWNEIGDKDVNFEQLVIWNIEQHLSHS